MKFTLRTAAQHTNTSKSTILRAIKSGRMSAIRLEDGSYEIDPAELERVYPQERMQRRQAEAMEHRASPDDTPAPAATAALAAQVEALREILKRADAMADELRREREKVEADRDRWRDMAENQQRLLADQRTPKSWWQRLVG